MDGAGPPFVEQVKCAHPDMRIEVWFEDEMRFGQQGTLARVWAPIGSRPRVVKQTEYEAVYVFGAANPTTGESAAMVLPTANTRLMNMFLAHLSEQVAPDVHVVLVLDNAGWHTGTDLEKPENLTLLPLPPYAPELNAIEHLWDWMRSSHLANRAYLDYDAVLDAGCDAWESLTPDRIKSLCATSWSV